MKRATLAIFIFAFVGVCFAAIDQAKNFAKVTVSTGYNSAATSIVLSTGDGARLPATAPYSLVWWNSTDYPDPSDDPNREIVQVTAISTDTLTVTRGFEGTSAANHNTAAKVYKMIGGPTARLIDQTMANDSGIATNAELKAIVRVSGPTESRVVPLTGTTPSMSFTNGPKYSLDISSADATLSLTDSSFGGVALTNPVISLILTADGTHVLNFPVSVYARTWTNQPFAAGDYEIIFDIMAGKTNLYVTPSKIVSADIADGTIVDADVATAAAIALTKLANIANNRILANISGSSAPASAQTFSDVVDSMIGSTRGSIMIRGSGGWAILTPGTSGYALISNGSGADPSYQAVSGGGANWTGVGATNSSLPGIAYMHIGIFTNSFQVLNPGAPATVWFGDTDDSAGWRLTSNPVTLTNINMIFPPRGYDSIMKLMAADATGTNYFWTNAVAGVDFIGTTEVSDTAWSGSTFNSVGTIAPSKNVLYDLWHLMDTDDDGLPDKLDLGTAGLVKTTSGGVISTATAETDYTTPTGSGALQNKTIQSTAAAGNNTVKTKKFLVFDFDRVSGTSATIPNQADATLNTFGRVMFTGNVATTNTNFAEYSTTVPLGLSTAEDLKVEYVQFRTTGTQTGAVKFDIGMTDIADSAAADPTSFSNWIQLPSATLSSPAANDTFTISNQTLTGWRSGLTAGHRLKIRFDRNDTNTDPVELLQLVISYVESQ